MTNLMSFFDDTSTWRFLSKTWCSLDISTLKCLSLPAKFVCFSKADIPFRGHLISSDFTMVNCVCFLSQKASKSTWLIRCLNSCWNMNNLNFLKSRSLIFVSKLTFKKCSVDIRFWSSRTRFPKNAVLLSRSERFPPKTPNQKEAWNCVDLLVMNGIKFIP